MVVLPSGKSTWSAKRGLIRIGKDRYHWEVRDNGGALVLTPSPLSDAAPPAVYHRPWFHPPVTPEHRLQGR